MRACLLERLRTPDRIVHVIRSQHHAIGAGGENERQRETARGVGRCRDAVGNTVDLETATWKNSIGAAQLSAVWEDPDFDPKESAFYYARVLEIPTPRWVVYDKVRLGADVPKEAELVGQERAYTSPIRYKPKK